MQSISTLFATSLFLLGFVKSNSTAGDLEAVMHSDKELRKLQISSQSVSGFTYTCDLTSKAMSFGGTQDDQIVDVVADANGGGEIYACGHTYSTQYSSGDQDIVIFKFEPNKMSYLRPDGGWSLVWGGPLTETATGITIDDSSQFVYVSAYTNSETTLSSAKFDMLVLKVNANTGLLNWAKRFGSANNDKANGLTFYRGNLYVIGESDSVGWTGVGARTDMVFLKLDPSTSLPIFANFLGGTAEDFGLKIVGHSDGFLYALGQGYSTEFTRGTIDPFIIRFDETGALDYMASFGSSNPDYGSDLKVQGSLLVILGQSQSVDLSQGFLDIFIAMANKDSLQTVWVRYIGTSSFDEIGKTLHILPDGTIWALGQIQANGFTNGNNDLLLMSLGVDGSTRFVQNMGATISELPGGMVYSQTNDKMNIFANTNSIFFKNQGGFDWLFFQLDKRGRNQCTALGLKNLTNTLQFKSSNVKFGNKIAGVQMRGISNMNTADVTNIGFSLADDQLQRTKMQTWCQNFGPIVPLEPLHNITVIENTQMIYQAPQFCDDQSEPLNYVLTKGDGTGLDQWMMWDKNSRTMTGLVPIGIYKFLYMRLTGTDKGGLSTSTLFNITFVSKPYLNRAIDNYEIRTEMRFTANIPRNTFIHPNNDQMTISVDQVPNWLTYNANEWSFSGRPTSQNVGTFTILVTATDSKNESTTTSFKIEVQKNYVPVVQKQVDDFQMDLNQPFELELERDTFVDPNGDPLNITATRIPRWMQFDRQQLRLTGVPTVYGVYNVSFTAVDGWNASATMSFQIVAGIQPNNPPEVMTSLQNQVGYMKELFYYKLPSTAFNDSDGDELFYLVSQANGNYLPSWLIFEEITQTFSGIPDAADPLQNVTEVTTVQVVADDRRGGVAKQIFNITLIKIQPEKPTYSGLVIVSCLMGAFFIVIVGLICKRQCSCKSKKKSKQSQSQSENGQETDDDSYDEDDDIIIASAKPKNPFRLIQENDVDQKYKLYGPEQRLPQHALVRTEDQTRNMAQPIVLDAAGPIEEEIKQQ